jgi:Extensin-like protein C-terminus
MDSRSFEEEFERGALRSKAVDPHQRLALWTMVVWVVACLLTACPTAAGTIPLPRARPASIPREQSLPREATTEVSPCQLGLGDFGEFRPAPSITGPGDCTATDVVTLEAVRLPDRHRVVISPAVTLRCSMAEEFARWIRDDVAPTIAAVGASLTGVETVDSFDCRGFNGVGGARTSEHGHANALDIRAFKLTNGDVIQLNDAHVPKSLRGKLRQTACARFSTVLGNGADAFHQSNVHIDLMQRTNNYKICQWDVLDVAETAALAAEKPAMPQTDISTGRGSEIEVPLPRPRPKKQEVSVLRHHPTYLWIPHSRSTPLNPR